MATVTREKAATRLPQISRGDVLLATIAVLTCLLALILKVSGIA